MIEQLQMFLKGIIPAGAAAILLFVGYWFQGVQKKKRDNDIKEIDLSAKKIDFETHTAPIDELVSKSNSSHGVRPDEMVKPPRSDDENGSKS